jgi:hypothetical protein
MTRSLPREFVRFIEQLDARRIPYWLNSGTLLGIVRDGGLLAWDRDVDISVWESDRDAVLKLVSEFDPEHYRVETWRFGGAIYKIKAVSTRSEPTLVFDVDLFRKHGDMAVCPQYVPVLAFRHCWWLHRIVRSLCHRVAYFLLERNGHHIGDRFPLKHFHNVFTWSVPSRFFERTTSLHVDGIDVKVPQQYEDYLAYRYGNWRQPVSNWKFWEDDLALLPTAPDKLAA